MQDVKKSSSILIGKIDEMQMELDQEQEQKAEQEIAHDEKRESIDSQHEEVAAKAAPEPPKEEQEEEVHRGFRR